MKICNHPRLAYLFPVAWILFSVVLRAEVSQPSFIGWIPVQTVDPGESLEIDLSRFLFVAPGDRLEMEKEKNGSGAKITAELDSTKGILRLPPVPGHAAIRNLCLRIHQADGGSLGGILTVAAPVVPETVLRYSGKGPEKSVCLAGSFNGWNPTAHPFRKTAGNAWEISLALPPGSH
ncbi:MAG: hypothetical protein EBT68_08060, partial [Verrucomicrobia bacterium]|nr:hypothetical protein [Verrucomicrobiota bacterium]